MRARDATPDTERGQSYALEGIVAGAVVLAAIAVALQSAVITPQSTSATNQRIEVVEGTTADTMLDHAARNGSLREAVLFWDPDNRTFASARGVNASAEGYIPGPPPNQFGDLLNRTFYDENIAVNVYVSYTRDNSTVTKQMVFQGTPSNAAVSAARSVVLFDDDPLVDESGPTGTVIGNTNEFYAPDAAPNSSVYNVVEVRLVVWRI